MISKALTNKEKKLAVIGLGYVGLPVALAMAKSLSVIGFDIDEARIKKLQKGVDPSKEMNENVFKNCDISFTSSAEDLKEASFFIIAVPTPVDQHNVPDLSMVLNASEMIGKVIKKGDYVVFESTVYPGCTEEDCVPVIERISGLKMCDDFKAVIHPE